MEELKLGHEDNRRLAFAVATGGCLLLLGVFPSLVGLFAESRGFPELWVPELLSSVLIAGVLVKGVAPGLAFRQVAIQAIASAALAFAIFVLAMLIWFLNNGEV